MEPKFSIIIPVYNVEKYLKKCLDSIVKQTVQNREIILVDDGSIDSSGYICDEFAKKEENVKVFHQKNQGLSAARNTGVREASGEYLIFIDSDDCWIHSRVLEYIQYAIEKKPDIVVWSYTKVVDQDVERFLSERASSVTPDITYWSDAPLEKLMNKRLYIASAWDKAVRRDIFMNNNLWFEEGVTSEDVEWAARLAVLIRSSAVIYDEIYMYRQRAGSITKTITRKNLDDLQGHIGKCIQIGNRIQDDRILKSYWRYVAEQYANLLIVAAIVSSQKSLEDIETIKGMGWLLPFGQSVRCRIIYYCKRILGLKNVIRLLKICLKVKG